MWVDQKTILVVDDESSNIDVIKNILQQDYKIKAAINGEKALAVAAKLPAPDLILLDIMMPGLDGYEVCRALKTNPATRQIPVVFLSAKVTQDQQRQGIELGAVAYITKPVEPQILIDTVDLVLTI